MVAACKVRRKLFVAEIFNNEGDESNVLGANDYYQEDESLGTHNVILEKEVASLLDTNAPMPQLEEQNFDQTQSSHNDTTLRKPTTSSIRTNSFVEPSNKNNVVGAQSSKLSTLPVNKLIVLYVVFKLDESYTPSKVSILAGDGFHNLKEIKTVELVKPTG
ncbi:hypothetical protein JHK87_016029 [Glycine soja]|nr:hypothetical protein JHK87_016029 [Glycine soja]